jgi:hypothetical protein
LKASLRSATFIDNIVIAKCLDKPIAKCLDKPTDKEVEKTEIRIEQRYLVSRVVFGYLNQIKMREIDNDKDYKIRFLGHEVFRLKILITKVISSTLSSVL